MSPPLTYVDEFWKEPDRAVITGVRTFSNGTELAIQEPILGLAGMNWAKVRVWIKDELEKKMKAEGIEAVPASGWTAWRPR